MQAEQPERATSVTVEGICKRRDLVVGPCYGSGRLPEPHEHEITCSEREAVIATSKSRSMRD